MQGSRACNLQTLLIGVDAGCFNVLDPMIESGDVPNLTSLIEDGVSSTLESQIPPWTASAWPSLYTGANPGKHGVYGFLSFDGYDWDIVNASHVREHTIWELLDQNGLTSVVVNAPVTYPPPDIDGAVVPGYVAPESPQCHPDGLLEEVTDAIGEYRVYTPSLNDSAPAAEKVQEYRDLVRMRGEAFRYLADRFDPDFGFLQFQVTDTVLHEFPGDRSKARQVYRAVDDQIGTVLSECDPETVIVVSDHGMDAYEQRFSLNEFLRQNNYVETVKGGTGMPTWAAIRDSRLVDGETSDGPEQSALATVMERLADVGITSQRAGNVLERLGLADLVMRVVPNDVIRAGSEQVDFPESTAYMRSRVECGVRINLAGREPDGIVEPENYERVRQDLIDTLRKVETSDGVPLFDSVLPREEVFSGQLLEDAVDVVTVPNDFEYYLTTWVTDGIFEVPEGPAWDHTRNGIVVASGTAVDSSVPVENPHLFDVAPTVLSTLDVPFNDRMDGNPLPFVDDAGSETYDTVEAETVAVTDEQVEARLSNLGYME